MISNLISIITPVFNNEQTIRETIDSVINQTYSNWELILVDDGSTDKSIEVINKYVSDDTRIRLIIRDREPKGGSTCRNIGAFDSKGEYLIFLDSDDLLSNTCLENRLKHIQDKDYKFIAFPMASFDERVEDYKIYSNTKHTKYLYYFSMGLAPWQITSTFWKSSFFRELNGFDETFQRLQDVEIHLRAIIHSKDNFYYFKEKDFPDCFYRIPKKNKGKSLSKNKVNNALLSFPNFIYLRHQYKDSFNDRYMNSVSSLMLICNIYYLIDISDYSNNKRKSFKEITKKHNPKEELLFKHRLLYILINYFVSNTKLNLFLVRVIKKMLKTKF